MIHPFSRIVLDKEATGSSESKRAAMDPNFKSIGNEVMTEVDCENPDDLVNIRPNAKVVILKNCKNLSKIVDSEFLRNVQNTQVFVIIVRLSGAYDKTELGKLSDKIATPTILQIDNAGSSRLFFTTTEKKCDEVETGDSHNERLSTHFDFNFVCNLLYSEQEWLGKFSFEINEMKIDPNACFKGNRLVDLAVENGDLLTLKFLMLFQPEIEAFNGDKKRILEILVEKGNLEFLKTVLGIPDQAENYEAHLSAEKRNALNLLSNDGLSLLMIAARSEKNDVIKFLLKCGLNVNILNNKEQTACDFAWTYAHHNSVVELVKADSPFPYDFDYAQLSVGSKLKRISEERDTLHEQIRNNQIDEVKKFVEQNPKIKCAYDERNQSALVTALESKNFEIYSLLRSKGYTSGIDGDEKEILSTLTNSEKTELKFSNRKYFPTNENVHIIDLLSRSRLGFGSEQNNFEKIQKYFEALDAIPEVRPILQVISTAKKLDVVFDFNQESIAEMDPTQNFEDTVVKGRTIYTKGNILIGAKSNDAEILATMAHEFTHYAMHLMYDNLGHPYCDDEENRKHEFEEIVNFCEAKKALNAVIENVFEYPPDEHAQELIVRVPQLLALHSQDPNKIAKARENFEKLFGFFTNRVLPECKRETPLMKAKESIRNVNKISELKKEAEASELLCDRRKISCIEVTNKFENILITSSVPNLVLYNLLNDFKKKGTRNVDSLHIFLQLQQLMDPKHGEMIREAFESNAKPKLFVLETKDVINYGEIKEFYNYQIMSSKVVTIAKSVLVEKEDEENFKNVFPIQRQIEYKWCDLNETSRLKILSSKVNFQGLEKPLSDLLSVDSKILKELPLGKVFKLSEMKLNTVNEAVPSGLENYIERTFKDAVNPTGEQFGDTKNPADDTLTTDNVIELLISKKSLILADDSGMGKTTTALHLFTELKQRYPRSWVVHIDLKQHTDSFYKDDEVSPDDITSEFFSAKILKLDDRVEHKFFEHFYDTGKVIFIIDGFDEICPNYKNSVLKVVEKIQKSKNVLLVTTRTHLMKVLEKKMSSRVIKLHRFTIDDQVEFLIKFWTRCNERSQDELKAKARSLLERFRETMTKRTFFGVPLHVRMLAEIYEKLDPTEDDMRELNVFTLFQRFIEKKIEIWDEKGPLAKNNRKIFHTSRTLNLWQIHQKLAIEMFFSKDMVETFCLPEIEEPLTDELLARIGLVQIEESKEFMFTHQSFSEYFVADFILTNVTKKTLLAKSDELHQVLLQTLNGEKFENVRSFMNAKLEANENLNVDVLTAKLEKSLEAEENRQFLNMFMEEKLEALVTFMLKTIKIRKILKVSLITQKDERGDTALHVGVQSGCSSSFKNLWNCIESFSDEAERTEILFLTDDYYRSVLHLALFEKNHETTNFLLKTAANFMDSRTFQKWLMQGDNFNSNALIYASFYSAEAFQMLWNAAEAKLRPEDLKELLFSQNSHVRNVLQTAIYSRKKECQEVIQSILNVTEKLFNYEEMKKFLFTEDKDGDTALHTAAHFRDLETFTILRSFIKEELKKSDQKTLWNKKNSNGWNIFITSIDRVTQKFITKEVISAAKEILDREEIWKAFTEKDRFNNSFISLATDFGLVDQIFEPEEIKRVASEYMARNNDINLILQKLSDALKDDLSAEDLKAALYAEVGDVDTALHFSLQFGSNPLVDRIFQLADMKLNKNDRLKLIQKKSIDSWNILWQAGKNVYSQAMDIVCNFLIRQKDLVAEVKVLLMEKNDNKNNFFSYAAIRNRSCLIDVLKWFKENFNFSHEDLQKVVFARNADLRTLTDLVAAFCDESLRKTFFDFCLSSFGLLELKEIILDKSSLFDMLEISLRNPSSAVVSEVWNFYVKTFNEVELEELLFKTDRGRTYFNHGLELKNPKAVEALKTLITARYGEDKMLRLIRYRI